MRFLLLVLVVVAVGTGVFLIQRRRVRTARRALVASSRAKDAARWKAAMDRHAEKNERES